MTVLLCQGDWRVALSSVERADHIITDPPYSARTHSGVVVDRNDGVEGISSGGLGYEALDDATIAPLVDSWIPRVSGWALFFTSHDLVPAWVAALGRHDRYVFAPLACVQTGRSVRALGDGPANWTDWLVVSRPRSLKGWGALPGAYVGTRADTDPVYRNRDRVVAGSKPLWMMRALVRDYSRPGDLIVDPYAGGASTLIAAQIEGRSAIGAELDPATYERASAMLRQARPMLFGV